MAYAGMQDRWHEVKSVVSRQQVDETLPLFMVFFSSDKGTEEVIDVTADDFFKMYGYTADFFKHGQPLLQAHAIAKSGGRLLAKRLVADDSTLANIIISAEVTEKTIDKKNAQGEQLYTTPSGEETTEASGNQKATFKQASIKYHVDTVENATGIAAVKEQATTIMSGNTKIPLFIICDNGRGASIKKVRITSDYLLSKKLPYQIYNIIDIETTGVVETKRFSINPDAIYTTGGVGKNMSLTATTTTQFNAEYYSDGITKFIKAVSTITGYSNEQLFALDVLFGNTTGGKALANIAVDPSGVDLTNEYGIALTSGKNGAFGDAPFKGEECTEALKQVAIKYLDGKITDKIYDKDLYKLDFVGDANFPVEVKNKVAELLNFRKDAVLLRDLGTDVWSYDDVYNMVTKESWVKTPFVGDYLSTYEIIDPYSKKQVRVTCIYHMVQLLVKHFAGNLAAPLAGEFNSFVIYDAIPNTLNFAPRHTPLVNQKEMLDDLRVNFVNYSTPTELVVQSTYTSQDSYGPLSYINNVIITQMAVKAIRRYTPKIRFQLVDTNDFAKYNQLITDNVLSSFVSFFRKIDLVYVLDEEAVHQKIFTAALECYYNQFAQSEIFDVYAMDGTPEGYPGGEKVVTDIL